MSTRTIQVTDLLHEYILKNSLRESALLQRLREETAALPMARMQISPEQGQFMALLLGLLGARRTIEVGVFTGYSALIAAQSVPADGFVLACDVSEEWTAIGRKYWQEAGVADRIDLRLAPAQETLAAVLEEPGQAGSFDFAFIDADKGGYRAYYEACLELLRPGGVVAVDNTLWGGSVADPDNTKDDTVAIRNFNAFVHTDDRVDLSLLPIGDGLTLARKK
ncbi:MAG: class I SAM-dependent methyltransferase [bacterium]|nr:class I SAM-dependent methyltransferase [bacterium]